MRKVLVLSLSLVLVLGLTAFAVAGAKPETKAGKAAKVHGKVTALDDKSITVESTRAGKTETHTFTLNPDTKKPADLKVGSEVTIEFKEEGGQKIATVITAKPAKAGPKK